MIRVYVLLSLFGAIIVWGCVIHDLNQLRTFPQCCSDNVSGRSGFHDRIYWEAMSILSAVHPGMMTDNTMSPEILGWHEQNCKDSSPLVAMTIEADQPPLQMSSPQMSHLPASAFKAQQSSTAGPVGRAVRVQTPATATR